MRGHVGGAEDQVADEIVAAAVAGPRLSAVMRSCFPFSRVRYSSCSSSTFQDCLLDVIGVARAAPSYH